MKEIRKRGQKRNVIESKKKDLRDRNRKSTEKEYFLTPDKFKNCKTKWPFIFTSINSIRHY